MTPEQIEKAADNFKFAYSFVSEQAIARRGFISGANLVMERVRRLEEALKEIIKDCGETSCPIPCRAMCSNTSHKIARAALEGK